MKVDVYSSFEPGPLARLLAAWNLELGSPATFRVRGPADLRWGFTQAQAAGTVRVLLLDPNGAASALLAGETLPGLIDAIPAGPTPPLVFTCPPRRGTAPLALPGGRATVLDAATLAHAFDPTGSLELVDRESDQLAGVPYVYALYQLLATELFRRARALLVPGPKVIAVDCDNTLWRGLCAEEGPLGVELGEDELALQELLLRQRAAGRLIALVSKNAPADVEAVFREHPGMRLRLADLAAVRIGWEAKSSGLRALSAQLNLPLDSFAFLDDSALECAEVRAACPEVSVLPLGGDRRTALAGAWFLDLPARAAGGLNGARTRLYQEEAQRHAVRARAPSYHDFVVSLGVESRFSRVGEAEHDRVFELAQRTNQFNTSAQRPGREQVAEKSDAGQVEKIEVRDRLGVSGLCGAIFAEPRGERLVVTRLLLSCRVLGRGVEEDLLEHLLARCQREGFLELAIEYEETERNVPARRFLERLGGVQQTAGAAHAYLWPAGFALPARRYQLLEQEPAEARPPAAPAPDWERIAALTADPVLLSAAAPTDEDGVRLPGDRDAAVLSIVAGVLGKSVTAQDNLHRLGADSLGIVRILARLRQQLGIAVSIADVLHDSGVSDLLRLAAQAGSAPAPPAGEGYLDAIRSLYDDEALGP